jgi:hypothetical protein
MSTENPRVQETDVQALNELDVTIPVPGDVVQRARSKRAAFTDANPDREPPALREYIVDELQWQFDPDQAPGE